MSLNYILSDAAFRTALLPFTFTRPVSEIRIGILTIREKWEKYLDVAISHLTEDYLQDKFPLITGEENIVINSSVLPNPVIINEIKALQVNEALVADNLIIAYRTKKPKEQWQNNTGNSIDFKGAYVCIKNVWDIFLKNDEVLRLDFELVTKGRKSEPISTTNTVIGDAVFLEKGAKVEASILNAKTGPIYVGKDAEIMEGCIIRGGLALGENAILKMGAKIYGASTFGPFCKVGGEVNNAVLFAFSNKGHEGYLGNSVLGEWCNIGADTNTSNLKNNYASVRVWDYQSERFSHTGLQFCGLIMGDHSKAGINTMFNTGTVVGVSSNIFGSGFPRNFIPSFSWGGASGFSTYTLSKAFETAQAMMRRKGVEFDEKEQHILKYVFEHTQKWRNE